MRRLLFILVIAVAIALFYRTGTRAAVDGAAPEEPFPARCPDQVAVCAVAAAPEAELRSLGTPWDERQ